MLIKGSSGDLLCYVVVVYMKSDHYPRGGPFDVMSGFIFQGGASDINLLQIKAFPPECFRNYLSNLPRQDVVRLLLYLRQITALPRV